MTEKRGVTPPPGGSSLLTIVAVLCLTTLALLSLATVQADTWLAERSSEAVEAYFAADSQAEEILARLRAGELPDGVTEQNGVFSYACPIADGRVLQIQTAVDGAGFTILQ